MTLEDDLKNQLSQHARRATGELVSLGAVQERARQRARRKIVLRSSAIGVASLLILGTLWATSRPSSDHGVAHPAATSSTSAGSSSTGSETSGESTVVPTTLGSVGATPTSTSSAVAGGPPHTDSAGNVVTVPLVTTTSIWPVSTSTTPTTVLVSSRCHASELEASMAEEGAAMGNLYGSLVLRNVGTRTCQLRGYPGVSLLDAHGAQIGDPATRSSGPTDLVPLAPGAVASAQVHTANHVTGTTCTSTSTSMKVYPPNEFDAIVFPVAYTACGGFDVAPLVARPDGITPPG